MAKQFAPHIYRDWLPLFMTLPAEQAAEVLKGIAGFPDYEVKGVAMWDFFKSQLEKEYAAFTGRSEKARASINARWSNTNEKNVIRNDTSEYEPIRIDTNEYERIKSNTNEYEAIRDDTNEKNVIRNDTNDFTKRNKEKTPPAPPKEENNKNIYTPSNINVCSPKAKNFIPPTVEEVRAYIAEKAYSVDADRFVDFYTAKGWMIGSNKMKDWKAAVRTWERDRQNAVRAGTVVSFGVKSGSYSGSTPL